MKKNPRTPKEILVIVISAVLLVASIILLGLWTKALTREERSNMLRLALSELVEAEGERGLLEAAGVPVDDIHYSYEDLPLFADGNPSWEFTDEEKRKAHINAAMHVDEALWCKFIEHYYKAYDYALRNNRTKSK